MANSRKQSSADLLALVAESLQATLWPRARVLLGLSGGLDSMVLLDILHRLAPKLDFFLSALYVNHGLSTNAVNWGEFCEAECRSRAVPFAIEKVDLSRYRGLGLEGAAREARYRALASHATDIVALAQHRDDQAETLLLQLLRGAGVKGLGGMPAERGMDHTVARLVRPFIQAPRSDIESYARERGLKWVEDESNSDRRLMRNFVRHGIVAALEKRLPGARAVLARSAEKLAEAAGLLDQLGDEDLVGLLLRGGLDAAKLVSLGEARARNVLRRWCERRGVCWPGTARLNELLRQLSFARPDAAVAVATGSWCFRLYRGVLYLESKVRHSGLNREWRGEETVSLSELDGVLRFQRAEGTGLCAAKLAGRKLTFRLRRGGEKLRPDGNRPRRNLKYLFQEYAIPHWQRDQLPLIFCDNELVAIPGVAEDCRWRAQPGEAGVMIIWERAGQA